MASDAFLVEEDAPSLKSHLFNTTFSTFGVSPLYVGGSRALDEARLTVLSQRLRAALVGDVVRGVEVGLDGSGEDPSLGALELVEVKWTETATVLGEPASGSPLSTKALLIELRYENAICSAILLPPLTAEEGLAPQEGFIRLPLLLVRMPAGLKPFMVDWLSSTFDCRIRPLRLGTRTLVRCFESWLQEVGAPQSGPLAKDAVLTLGFYVPPSEPTEEDRDGSSAADAAAAPELAIKTIDVIITAVDLGNFAQGAGQASSSEGRRPLESWETNIERRKQLAGGKAEEGWAWRQQTPSDTENVRQPFTEALARYLDQNLALNLFHPGVRVTKIACAGFVISETKLKVFEPPSTGGSDDDDQTSTALMAVRRILADLTRRPAVK